MAPITYTNRRGKTYYLHTRTTKSGKSTCCVSARADGQLADTIPEGFEIYEEPNGKVFVRKTPPRLITDTETAIVQDELERNPHLKGSLLDRNGKTLTVHVMDLSDQSLEVFTSGAPWKSRAEVERILKQYARYSAEMRFILVDEANRTFQAQRYCYRGSIDDWIDVGLPGPLRDLARTCIPHLGQDSCFELF